MRRWTRARPLCLFFAAYVAGMEQIAAALAAAAEDADADHCTAEEPPIALQSDFSSDFSEFSDAEEHDGGQRHTIDVLT